jgi:hypothetical protein
MSISHILRSGLAEARDSGAKQVELRHLPEGGADDLANETLAFLRGRPGRPSSVSGWTALSPAKAGVVRWWADEAGLTTQAQRRSLQTLRRQIYDLLDGRGVIVKPVSPSAVVDVSPAAEPEPPEAEPTEAEPTEAEPTEAEPTDAETTDAETTDAETTEAETTEAEPATPEPSATAVTEGVGAWILRLDPTVWDLARFLADGHREVRAWAVEDDERAAAMARGQRVFLWAGGDGTVLVPGIWGVGWVVGPCESKSVADGYWVDPAGNSRRTLFADVSIQLLPLPVGLQQVVDDPRLAGIEVLRDPDGGNPSRLTPEEAAAMVALVGSGPAPPA